MIESIIEKTAREAAERHLRGMKAVVPEYLTGDQAATYIGMDRRSLDRWRQVGGGPAYTKLDRAVRYRRADLDEFMLARRVSK